MSDAIFTPLTRLAREVAGGLRAQAAATLATLACVVVAIGFLTAAGFVALAGVIGESLAALAFSALAALAAACAHFVGRADTARRAARVDADRKAATLEIALRAGAVAGQTRLLLPLATFVAAFVLARRP